MLAGFVFTGFAQSESVPQNQVTVGTGWYDTDAFNNWQLTNNSKNSSNAGADSSPAANKFGQSDRYSPSFNFNGAYVYTLRLDTSNTLKFGFSADWWWGYGYTGNIANDASTLLDPKTNSSYTGAKASSFSSIYGGGEAGQNAGKVGISGEYLGYGFDATLAVPLYFYNAGDNGGYNEFKYAYSEGAYMPTNDPTYPAGGNNVILGTDLKIGYKYRFENTTWVGVSIDGLETWNPTPWFVFAKPAVSGAYAGFQLDIQFDYFNGYYDLTKNDAGRGGAVGNGTTSTGYYNQYGGGNYFDTFLEPKLSYDFGTLGVAGLKAFVSSKISLATDEVQYNGSTTANGYQGYIYNGTQPFSNTSLTSDVSYAFKLSGMGTFVVEGAFKIYRLGDSGSDQCINPPTYVEPQIKVSYGVAF
jgi:hypothetical protein